MIKKTQNANYTFLLTELRVRKAKEKEEKMIEAAKAMLSVPVLPIPGVQPVQTPASFGMALPPGTFI